MGKTREISEKLTKRFAENVRAIVAMRKLSMGETEKKAGVSIGYISRKLNNSRETITLLVLLSFAEVLGIDWHELIEKDFSSEYRRKRIAELEEEIRILKELEGEKIAV